MTDKTKDTSGDIEVQGKKPNLYKAAIEKQDSYLDDPRVVKAEQELDVVFTVGEKEQRKWNIGRILLSARPAIPSDKLFGQWVKNRYGNTEIGSTETRSRYMKLARLDSWEMVKPVGGLTKCYNLTTEQCDQLNARWDEESKEFDQPIDDVIGSSDKPTMQEITANASVNELTEFGFNITDIEQDPKLAQVGVTIADLKMQIMALTKQVEQLQKSPSKGKATAQTKTKKREEGQPLTEEEKAANTEKLDKLKSDSQKELEISLKAYGQTIDNIDINAARAKFFKIQATAEDTKVINDYRRAFTILNGYVNRKF